MKEEMSTSPIILLEASKPKIWGETTKRYVWIKIERKTDEEFLT